jgi:hypothetical protein
MQQHFRVAPQLFQNVVHEHIGELMPIIRFPLYSANFHVLAYRQIPTSLSKNVHDFARMFHKTLRLNVCSDYHKPKLFFSRLENPPQVTHVFHSPNQFLFSFPEPKYDVKLPTVA